jgi:hypothetical protein
MPRSWGVRHPLRARSQVSLDDRQVELLQHGDEPAQPGIIVGHVIHGRLVAADVAQLEEGVAVAEADL